MSTMNEVHKKAMDLATYGLMERHRGNAEEALGFFKQALEHEFLAIAELKGSTIQPTYSVLHRSAATLAIDCGNDRLAGKLAIKGIRQDTPSDVARELRDVLDQLLTRMNEGVMARTMAIADEPGQYGVDAEDS